MVKWGRVEVQYPGAKSKDFEKQNNYFSQKDKYQ